MSTCSGPGCSGIPAAVTVAAVALVVVPGLGDGFTSVKWHALAPGAAALLLHERLICRSRGLPGCVRRTWPLLGLLAAWVVAGSLRFGLAWAVTPLLSRAVFVAIGLASYWSFRRSALDLRPLRASLAAAASAVAVLGLLQTWGHGPFPGWLTGDQRSATFGNVNMAAQFVGLALVVGLSAPHPRTRARRVAHEALSSLLLAHVLLCRTRSVWIALAAATLVLLSVARVKPASLARVVIGAAAVVGLTAAVAGAATLSYPTDSKSVSAGMRLAVWRDTLELVRDHPLGVGAGNFEHAFLPYALAGRSNFGETLVFRSPHNEYLRLLAEDGVPGVLLLFVLAIGLVRALGRSPALAGGRTDAGAVLAAGAAFLAVEAFFQFPFELAATSAVAATLLGLALAAAEEKGSSPTPARAGACTGSVVAVACSVVIAVAAARGVSAEWLAGRQDDPGALERACRLDPRQVEACVERAWHDSLAGRHAAAQQRLASVLRTSPAYPPALKLRAEDHLAAGQLADGCEAARSYHRLLRGRSSLRPQTRALCGLE